MDTQPDPDFGNVIPFPNVGAQPVADGLEADLFSTVVHELRQPLTVIRGQLQIGRRSVGTDPTRERAVIDLAIRQVDRMDRLLGELLDSAGVAGNRLSLEVEAFDLVGAIVDAVGMHDDGDDRRISFEWPHGTVPVRGDLDRIAQIFDNLLSNAVKYSAPGSPIEITLTMHGGEAQVRIADHGLGIPADERNRLFAPFYRTTSTRGVPGTGLGLHISRRLAERHGGRLWLEASSGAGSVFALALPVAVSELGSLPVVGVDDKDVVEIAEVARPLDRSALPSA